MRYEIHPLPPHSPVHAAMQRQSAADHGAPGAREDYYAVVDRGPGAQRTVAVALRADAEAIARALEDKACKPS